MCLVGITMMTGCDVSDGLAIACDRLWLRIEIEVDAL
jgi:hypothetical protein